MGQGIEKQLKWRKDVPLVNFYHFVRFNYLMNFLKLEIFHLKIWFMSKKTWSFHMSVHFVFSFLTHFFFYFVAYHILWFNHYTCSWKIWTIISFWCSWWCQVWILSSFLLFFYSYFYLLPPCLLLQINSRCADRKRWISSGESIRKKMVWEEQAYLSCKSLGSLWSEYF